MASPQNQDYRWTQHFNSKKAVASTARSNPQLMAFGGALGAAHTVDDVAEHSKSPKVRRRADQTKDAVTGAAAGQAAYQASGYGAKHLNAKVNDPKVYKDPKHRRGYTNPEYKKKVEGAKKDAGIKSGGRDFKSYLRNYPKDVPGGKVTRTLAHTHMGNRGVAVGAAATAAGALIGLKAGEKDRDKVSKADPHADSPFLISKGASVKAFKYPGKLKGTLRRVTRGAKTAVHNQTSKPASDLDGKAIPSKTSSWKHDFTDYSDGAETRLSGRVNAVNVGVAAGATAGGIAAVQRDKKRPAARRLERAKAQKKELSKGAFRVTSLGTAAGRASNRRWPNLQARDVAAGGALGGGLTYALSNTKEQQKIRDKDYTQRAKKIETKNAKKKASLSKSHEDSPFLAKNLSQKQIDRRKKIQAATSNTTATLGLTAGAMQGGAALLSRGKLKGVKNSAKVAQTLRDKTVPVVATSGAIGGVGGYNFASYTKAEAQQRKKK